MKEFEQQIGEYGRTLSTFIIDNNLPGEWFRYPDHLAVKCVNREDFLRTALYWKRHALGGEVRAIDMDKRTLASVHLAQAIPVGALGEVEWLEVMEPRPEKVDKDIVGLEHMEFFYPHLDRVVDILKQNDVDFQPQDNPGHAWINIVLNAAGQEFKINDRPLRDIVAREIETGESYLL